jgi:transposase
MFRLGADCHKATHTLSAVDGVGCHLDTLTIDNEPQGYAKAYGWACRLGPDRVWGIENSGHFGRGLAQYLVSCGERVLEVSPHLTGKKRRRSFDRSKSDPNDALAVARVVLQDGPKLHQVVSEDQTMQVKVLVEQRDNLVGQRVRLLNQLHAHLTEVEPHYKKRLGQLKGVKALQQCQAYPLPQDDPIAGVRVTIIRQLATLVLLLDEQIEQLEALMAPLVQKTASCLLSIQGVSLRHAAKLIARVGHIQTVHSAASLAHYCGIAPVRCGSAGNYHHRVNPKGDRQLNAVFHRIAQVQSRYNPLAQAYLAKKKAEGKSPKHAFRCLKRRMVDVVFAVWKSGKPYQAPVSGVAEAA